MPLPFRTSGRDEPISFICCHGRPSRFGIVYGDEHMERGFTWYYAGIRLFPLQLLEAAWVLGIVAVSSIAIFRGEPAGIRCSG